MFFVVALLLQYTDVLKTVSKLKQDFPKCYWKRISIGRSSQYVGFPITWLKWSVATVSFGPFI